MDRRRFLLTSLAGALTAPLASEAQPVGKAVRIGILWPGTCPLRPPRVEAFRRGLADSGYIGSQNLTVEFRCAEDAPRRLPKLAAELVDLNVLAIAAIGTAATRAAQQTTTAIPIVALADALVQAGLVASLAKPGGNITGVQILAPELNSKKLQLLKEIVPTVSRVAVLSDPDQSEAQLAPLKEAARSFGLQLQVLHVRVENDIESALHGAKRGGAGALHVLASPLLFAYSRTIIGLAAKHRLPAIYEWREAVEAGGLASYGPILYDMWRQTGLVMGKILNGAKPSDLPIEQPTNFELVINMKTAKALGLTIAPSLLLRADQVIE